MIPAAKRTPADVKRRQARYRYPPCRLSAPAKPRTSRRKSCFGRRGKLSAVGAALETSLSVGEAERMLQALAAKGHLVVSGEHGSLVYALWERDAPL
jgi:hypothetical protein